MLGGTPLGNFVLGGGPASSSSGVRRVDPRTYVTMDPSSIVVVIDRIASSVAIDSLTSSINVDTQNTEVMLDA